MIVLHVLFHFLCPAPTQTDTVKTATEENNRSSRSDSVTPQRTPQADTSRTIRATSQAWYRFAFQCVLLANAGEPGTHRSLHRAAQHDPRRLPATVGDEQGMQVSHQPARSRRARLVESDGADDGRGNRRTLLLDLVHEF